MYLGDREADDKPLALAPALQVALIFSLVGVLVTGVFPQHVIKLAQDLLAPWIS